MARKKGVKMFLDNLSKSLNDQGFVVLRGVFDEGLISHLRDISIQNLEQFGIKTKHGLILPGASFFSSTISKFIESEKITEIMDNAFGDSDYSFLGHSDVHMNNTSFWHKDDGGKGGVGYFGTVPYSHNECRVYKVGIFLQDEANGSALTVKKGSHLSRSLSVGDICHMSSRVGDVFIFDVRITHRSFLPYAHNNDFNNFYMSKIFRYYKSKIIPYNVHNTRVSDRVSLFFTFGKRNKFSKSFHNTNMERQISQHKKNSVAQVALEQMMRSKL